MSNSVVDDSVREEFDTADPLLLDLELIYTEPIPSLGNFATFAQSQQIGSSLSHYIVKQSIKEAEAKVSNT